MRQLWQFTIVAFIVVFALVPVRAEAQNRIGLEIIAGVTGAFTESGLDAWAPGPGIGLGATYALFPAVTSKPSLDVGIRAVYHHLRVSGEVPASFVLPRIPGDFWTTGNPLQSIEFSGQLELLLGGRAARISPIISLGGGVNWMRHGEVRLHYDFAGQPEEGVARRSRSSRRGFISPGVGATGKVFGHHVTAEARAGIDGDGHLMLFPFSLRMRL